MVLEVWAVPDSPLYIVTEEVIVSHESVIEGSNGLVRIQVEVKDDLWFHCLKRGSGLVFDETFQIKEPPVKLGYRWFLG